MTDHDSLAEYNAMVRHRKGRDAGWVPYERPEDRANDEQRERMERERKEPDQCPE